MSFEQGDKVKAEAGVDAYGMDEKGRALHHYSTSVSLRGVVQETFGPNKKTPPSTGNFVQIDEGSEFFPGRIMFFYTDDLSAEDQQHGITDNATFEENYGDIIKMGWKRKGKVSGARGSIPDSDNVKVSEEDLDIYVHIEGVPPALDTEIELDIPGLDASDFKVIDQEYNEKVGSYCVGEIKLIQVSTGTAP